MNVIFPAPRGEVGPLSRVMAISPQIRVGEEHKESKRSKVKEEPVLGFSEADKVGTIQSHNDALVVTLQIRGFDVKRVMMDQESGAEIMYLDLY